MDTPGFKNENKTKPDETKEIEGSSDMVRWVSLTFKAIKWINLNEMLIAIS